MIDNAVFATMLNSPVRAFRGRVEIYNGSTLALICGCHDSLKSFTIERMGENKFFGYGICQKLNVKLIDSERNITVSTANTIEIEFGVDSSYIYPCPNFYVTEVHRNENTNELSITAYDALYNATKYTVADLGLTGGYTLKEFAQACAAKLGIPLNEVGTEFNLAYPNGANFDGTETLREALNAVAEITQTIYYIDHNWELTFKHLDKEGAAALTIDKEKYFELDSGDNRRLAAITHTTDLGENITASLGVSGTTQFIRENPFLTLREDVGAMLESALAAIGGLTINQFSCDWRGNFLLELGDKIELITKDNKSVYSYLLNDTMEFNGSLSQRSEWNYSSDEVETETNPTSLGDALKQTFARVDKANKQIELVASETQGNSEKISQLEINTDSISAKVLAMEESASAEYAAIGDSINTIISQVEAKMSAEDVTIEIKKELSNGVAKVETSTGFTFNEDGLTVSKNDSEMKTTITEDGMIVYRNEEAVLIANNNGVDATNLNATTYLIIGGRSRLENYGDNRTGCYWIGG